MDARRSNPGRVPNAQLTCDLLLTWIHQFVAEPLAESIAIKDQIIPTMNSLLDKGSLVDSTRCAEQRWLPANTTLSELLETSWSFAGLDAQRPSYQSFVSTFHQHRWQKCLKWRTESQHAQCTECAKLKEFRRQAYSKNDSDRIAQAYHDHLTAMLRDRQIDAKLNERAVQSVKGLLTDNRDHSVISLCVDGMDT